MVSADLLEREEMTKDEFIAGYCRRSGVTWEYLSQHKTALPCACGENGCDGWAMVSNNELAIKAHMDLYAPAPAREK
jgi:hypothetical protein